MWKHLLRLTPFAEVDPDHPVFRYETSRLRCMRSRSAFEQHTLRWLGVGAAIGSGLLGATYLLIHVASINELREPPPIPLLCAIMIMASMALSPVSDYAVASAGLSAAIHRDLISDRWLLLRVTPLRESGLILAKYAAAQCRGWRSVMIMVGLRAALGGIWLVVLMITGNASLIAVITPIVVTGFVIAEPIERLRGFSALGTYVSSWGSSTTGGHLLLLVYLSGFWLAQLILLLSVILITAPLVFLLMLSADPALSLLWLIYISLIAIMSIGFALTVRAWALRATVRSIVGHYERQ